MLVTVIIAAALYYLLRNIALGYDELIKADLAIRYPWLVAGIIIAMLCTFLGGWEWNLLLSALGLELSLRKGLRIHVIANIAKYLPGYAWQMLGKVYLGRQENLPTSVLSLSIALEFAFILLTGLLLVGVFLPLTPVMTPLPATRRLYRIALWSGIGAFFAVLPFLLRLAVQRLQHIKLWGMRIGEVASNRIVFVIVAMFLTWSLLGASLCCVANSVYPLETKAIPTCFLALAVSFIASLVAVFVPAGWGVREAVLTYVLSYAMPAAVASLVALLARVALMVAEAMAFAVITRLKPRD